MVIYEDNHLLVVNKAPGTLVQGDATQDRTLLDQYKEYIKHKYNKPGAVYLHPVHRLDRPVGGCVILARTSKALTRMNDAFRDRQVEKYYYAITDERSSSDAGRLEHILAKDTRVNKTKVTNPRDPKGKKAVLQYELASAISGHHLYKVMPITGRGHQIRVQLMANKTPILGDVKYRGTETSEDRLIYLHCSAMTFVHPVKKEPMTVHCMPQYGMLWKDFLPFMGRDSI